MSHVFYDTQWQAALEELTELINIENPGPQENPDAAAGTPPAPRVITPEEAYQHFTYLYVRYLQVFRKLEDCYDQIVHPQKRRDIKLSLETVMARVVQIKHEINRFNPRMKTDFVNLDEYLIDLKLSPNQIEVPIPNFFREDEHGTQSTHMELIDAAYEAHGLEYQEDDTAETRVVNEMSVSQAVKIIQTAERGRQGLLRAKLMKELHEEEIARRRSDYNSGHSSKGRLADPIAAAVLIQRVFRGFLARKRIKEEKAEELMFIGMAPRKRDDVNASVRELAIRQLRKTRQIDNESQYKMALEDLKKTVEDTEGPDIKDRLRDERFRWWLREKEEKGKMHDDFEGFYKQKAAAAKDDDDEDGDDEKEEKGGKGDKKDKKGKGDKKDKKEKKGKGDKKKGKGDKKKKKGGDDDEADAEQQLLSSLLIGPSGIVTDMNKCVNKYKDVWTSLDESDNFQQRHEVDMAKNVIRPGVMEKIREDVDKTLLELLKNLKEQALKQMEAKGGKGKKGKKGGKKKGGKKKGGKKGKKGKGKDKKAKKCCDGQKQMTEADDLKSMISETVKLQVLQKLPRKFKEVKDFLGDLNFMGSAFFEAGMFVDPSSQQVRECVIDYGILPLGSVYTKQNSPLINSLLLFGPQGSGKSHLSKAIACHAGAFWFDLSPSKIKDMEKTQVSRLVHMVFTLAEQMQPAVIYIDEVDKVFAAGGGKKKATAGGGPTLLKKDLLAHKELLTADHRILIIGNAREPYDDAAVDRDELIEFFGPKGDGKSIFCPYPDYATRLKLWSHFITKKGLDLNLLKQHACFDLGALAHVSHGYPAGAIMNAVNDTLSARRVQQIHESRKPFDSSEFLAALAKNACVYDDQYKAYVDFAEEVSGEKARKQAIQKALAGDDEDDGGKGKKKDAKKKKK